MPDEQKSGDAFTHQPLPYIVRIRIIQNDDVVPEIQEFHIVAYSIIEAMIAGCFQAGGRGLEDSRLKVEDIKPDIVEYLKM